MDKQLVVNSQISIPTEEFQVSFVRSSGPGGQNVNKVSSKAVLRWAIRKSPSLPGAVRERFLTRYKTRITIEGELILTSQRYRDQPRNLDDCLEKLRVMVLEVSQPPKQRKPTRPTKGSKQRRLKEKKQVSEKKQQRRARPRLDD